MYTAAPRCNRCTLHLLTLRVALCVCAGLPVRAHMSARQPQHLLLLPQHLLLLLQQAAPRVQHGTIAHPVSGRRCTHALSPFSCFPHACPASTSASPVYIRGHSRGRDNSKPYLPPEQSCAVLIPSGMSASRIMQRGGTGNFLVQGAGGRRTYFLLRYGASPPLIPSRPLDGDRSTAP